MRLTVMRLPVVLALIAIAGCSAGKPAPKLPTVCPAEFVAERAEFRDSHIDMEGLKAVAMCRYSRVTVGGPKGPSLIYIRPVRLETTKVAGIAKALEDSTPFNPAMADCTSGGPYAVVLYLSREGRPLQRATFGGHGCGPLAFQGSLYGDARLVDAIRKAIPAFSPLD